MRYDRGIRVMLVRDLRVGREVWAPNRDEGDWVATAIIRWSNDGDKVEVEADDRQRSIESGVHVTVRWYVPRWSLRFRDPARQGRDVPRDRAEAPALRPKLKPGQVAKLGILSNGDIIGGQK